MKPHSCVRSAPGAVLALGLAVLGWTDPARAQPIVTLSPEAAAGFDAFVADVERVIARRAKGSDTFLWSDDEAADRIALLNGEILVEELEDLPEVENGMLHVWVGAMFVPGAQGQAVLDVLQDYDRHAEYYPEVTSSRTLGRDGDTIRAFLRLQKEQGLTVVLNTEHEARYRQVSPTRWMGTSVSTKIAEIENPGEPDERELPVGEDHGFLWRLYAYWWLEQSDDGVVVECLSVSMSRDIPRGLGWMLGPFVRKMPRRTLESTLQATRLAVLR